MNLYLLRHTAVGVPQGLCYGITDVPLRSTFAQDFDDVAAKLQGIAFDAVFSSPLSRCHSLAKHIAGSSLSVLTDERLVEMSFGDWEERLWCDVDSTPEAKLFFADFVHNPAPNGECFNQVIQRICSFVADLPFVDDDANILVVTHGGPIRAFATLFNDLNPYDAFSVSVDYGEVKVFEA